MGAAGVDPAGAPQATDARATRWVGLARACEILGVNESTIRRWADSGEIRCFRTPGGHRRFAEADLVAMTGQAVSTGAERIEEAAVSRIRDRLSAGSAAGAWLDAIDDRDRDDLRPIGRELVALVGDALRARRPESEVERAIDAIGRRYGEMLHRRNTPLLQAVEACTFFRRSLDETAMQLAEQQRLSAAESAQARARIALLADRVLLSVTTVYSGA